jgi:hypothetical protein
MDGYVMRGGKAICKTKKKGKKGVSPFESTKNSEKRREDPTMKTRVRHVYNVTLAHTHAHGANEGWQKDMKGRNGANEGKKEGAKGERRNVQQGRRRGMGRRCGYEGGGEVGDEVM